MDARLKRDETLEIILTAIMVWFGLWSFALIFQADILWNAAKASPVILIMWAGVKFRRLRNQ